MKTIVKGLALLFATISLVACSTLYERHPANLKTLMWLHQEGIFDPEVPTTTVHDLLTKGLYHQDSEIVTCSISVIVWYVGISDTAAYLGNPRPVDRRLDELPGLYDLFIGLWDRGWKDFGGIVPETPSHYASFDKFTNKTGCLISDLDTAWTTLVGSLVFLFPGDEKVHDIIWKQLSQTNPDEILGVLYDGNYNTLKDQQHRIDILTNPKTNRYNAILAAKSLGKFRAKGGVEALAKVLQEDVLAFVPPQLPIVEAMLTYETEAVPHFDLMRKELNIARIYGPEDKERKKSLQERLAQFEKDYIENQDNSSN